MDSDDDQVEEGLPAFRREDDSAEDLSGLARNMSATTFRGLQSTMQKLQEDVKRIDTCVICGEFGQCAPFSCCRTPRHLRCELEFAKANKLRWRLATASIRPDGSKSFRRMRPASTEIEYAAQLAAAGLHVYQIIPCSVCRKPLAAVRALGEFSPPAWGHVSSLRMEQAARNAVSMRGSHPYHAASGVDRWAVLAGYTDAWQFARWQLPWAIGVVVAACCLIFLLTFLRVEGTVGEKIAVSVPGALAAVLALWCCSHAWAVSLTRQQLREDDMEDHAIAAGGAITASALHQRIEAPTRQDLLPASAAAVPAADDNTLTHDLLHLHGAFRAV